MTLDTYLFYILSVEKKENKNIKSDRDDQSSSTWSLNKTAAIIIERARRKKRERFAQKFTVT